MSDEKTLDEIEDTTRARAAGWPPGDGDYPPGTPTTREAVVVIDYTNYKGERREREIVPKSVEFKETPDHKPAQWVLNAWDVAKQARRTFALKDIHSWRPAEPAKEAHGE